MVVPWKSSEQALTAVVSKDTQRNNATYNCVDLVIPAVAQTNSISESSECCVLPEFLNLHSHTISEISGLCLKSDLHTDLSYPFVVFLYSLDYDGYCHADVGQDALTVAKPNIRLARVFVYEGKADKRKGVHNGAITSVKATGKHRKFMSKSSFFGTGDLSLLGLIGDRILTE